MPKLIRFFLPVSLLISISAHADSSHLAQQVDDWRADHEQAIVDEFAELLSIPNVASDTVNIRRNAALIQSLLERRGLKTELLELEGSPPAIYGERLVPGAETTLMIYIHYDGQPVNPEDWASDPWQPVMRTASIEAGGEIVPMKAPFDPEWRIFGRSAGDDKAPIVALGAALDALNALGETPSVNLKVFLEGEEEAGSPHLKEMLTRYKDKLAADLWLFCDGPVHQSRRWQLVYGVRGTTGFNLTVYGPNRPLHSGHYGNWAPNPIVMLSELLTTMRDEQGSILIEGFSDQVVPVTETELAAIRQAPRVDTLMQQQLGLGRVESGEQRLEESLLRPALNVRGIRSGDVGALARNSIQTEASASIGIRLVPAQTPAFLQEKVTDHIRNQGYHVVSEPPSAEVLRAHPKVAYVNWSEHGYSAYRTSMDLPQAKALSGLLTDLSDGRLIQQPSFGGSLPLYLFDEVLAAPVIILPIANHDNNQHGRDENLRLQNLWDGITIYAVTLMELGKEIKALSD